MSEAGDHADSVMTNSESAAHLSDESLDPADWAHYRAVGHRILDALFDELATVSDRPVWRAIPAEVKAALGAPGPREPQPVDRVWEMVRELILPYPVGNTHPRFWGWVHGSGTAGGVLAEMIAAAMNANVGGREHAAVHVERQLLGWFKEIFGFPASAGGVVVTGSSMANLIGLCVARDSRAGADVRAHGVAAAGAPSVVYASAQAHVSTRKALEVLGLGADGLHVVEVDAAYRMDVAALRTAVAADRERGRHPLAVVGTAGTVNTGAIDPLPEIAALCEREGLWFHVDGAFGALAALSPALRERVAGIERADSLAFDFHKWLHAPYAAGCVLVRDGELHRRSFATRQSYLATHERGIAGGSPWFSDFGPDLSRGFAALKVWFTVQEQGLDRLGAAIARNVEQARYLAGRVAAAPDLELAAPVPLNVVCFRYAPAGVERGELDRINQEIIYELHEQGIAAPSTTRLQSGLVIRVCITNHRTRHADLDALVRAVSEIGERVVAGAGTG